MKKTTFGSILAGFASALASLFWIGGFLNRNFPDAPPTPTVPSHWATQPLIVTGLILLFGAVFFLLVFVDEVD